MNVDRLLGHYERIADAPDAIARLRRFILDLAVRGKLVEQNPNDEPASELLERIAAERKKRIARGEIRRAKPLNSITHTPFDPPSDWTWLPLGETGNIFTGNSINVATREQLEKTEEGRPFIATKDVGYGFEEIDYANGLLVELSDERFKIARSDSVLICAEGGSAGRKIALTDREISFGNKLLANETWSVISPKFVLCVYLSDFFYTQFAEKMTGVIGGISLRNFLQLPFPLPPLAEQHRIVAKVDELMALCDRLEEARTAREATRDQLEAASLIRLNDPDPDPVVFQNHAAFALENLAPLTTRTDQIKALRQTILNLAVRGKLVEQDPNEEPASELLKRRKIAVSSAMPFELPASWAWVNVGAVAVTRLGKMLDKAKNKGTPRRYLRNINVRWFDFDLSDLLEMRFEDSELSEFTLQFGDVLICEGGEPGRAAVWDGREDDIYFQKAIHRVRFLTIVDSGFFVKALRASADDGRLAEYFTGTGIKHFTGKSLAAYLFPLPPLPEQHRIITRVDELIALCDRLEASLATGEDTRRRLLDALLREVLMQTADRASVVQRPVW